jgi:hypothetical protein
VRARPSGMLQSSSLVAALRAAGTLPQSITRRIVAPSNHQRHQCHWRVVQTLLAMNPGPAVATLKVRKRWTWPRRLPLGMGAATTSQPSRHGSGIEVGGLAAHGAKVERRRGIPSRCGPRRHWRPGSPLPRPALSLLFFHATGELVAPDSDYANRARAAKAKSRCMVLCGLTAEW